MPRIATLKRQLADAKARAERNGYAMINGTLRPSSDWRMHAREKFRKPYAGEWQKLENMPRHSSPSDRAYFCDKWPDGLRVVGSAHDVCRAEGSRRVDHTGWYTDSFQDGKLEGYVLQLPARDGVPCYIPGTMHSDWDGVTLYPLDMHDNPLDCASAADSHAERAAEREREHEAEWRAEQETDELRGRIVELRAAARALIREIKALRRAGVRLGSATCGALRDKLADIREESRAAHDRIGKLADNYWHSVE